MNRSLGSCKHLASTGRELLRWEVLAPLIPLQWLPECQWCSCVYIYIIQWLALIPCHSVVHCPSGFLVIFWLCYYEALVMRFVCLYPELPVTQGSFQCLLVSAKQQLQPFCCNLLPALGAPQGVSKQPAIESSSNWPSAKAKELWDQQCWGKEGHYSPGKLCLLALFFSCPLLCENTRWSLSGFWKPVLLLVPSDRTQPTVLHQEAEWILMAYFLRSDCRSRSKE